MNIPLNLATKRREDLWKTQSSTIIVIAKRNQQEQYL